MSEEPFVDEVEEPDPQLNRITNLIIGAAIAVHNELGPGHLEVVYENAMALEFDHRGIRYERQVPFRILYRGQPVGAGRADFVVEDAVVLDLKAVKALNDVHAAQMIYYLRALRKKPGLLINFDVRSLRTAFAESRINSKRASVPSVSSVAQFPCPNPPSRFSM